MPTYPTDHPVARIRQARYKVNAAIRRISDLELNDDYRIMILEILRELETTTNELRKEIAQP